MSYLCGCYYYVASVDYNIRMTKHYLPLLDSDAHSTIFSTTSRTVLKQTFTNFSSEVAIKECIYTFPLYDGVSVVSFNCRIGSRVLRGLVKEKVKAKAIFDQAVARGETAGLLEQAPETSDVFSTKLGNIPAGKSVIVEITYIGELKHHETDGIRFTIPTSIAPRYGASPYSTVVHGSLPVQDNGGIKITVDVNMPTGSFIKAVQSPSHPIAVSMGTLSTAAEADPSMSSASATLSLGSAALEKDFVLIVHSKDIGTPKAILETHPTIANHRALMATLVPKFSLPPSWPEIVFVADQSGSMRRNISMLISAMKVFLKSMRSGVKFNICSFGSSYSFLWPQSKSYTSETLQQATAHVETFGANMGGTETFKAIKATIEQRFTDLPLEIMLLTDGDIWQQGNLFEYVNEQVEKTDGKIRIFPLGIGNGVSHSLIEGLARAGNGFAQSVQEGERLDNCVVRMLRGAMSPHITNYTLEVKYEKDDDDFEVIEKVTEGMKVLLADSEAPISTEKKPEQPLISLFDPNANPEKEDIEMQDAEPELLSIPHPKLLQAPHKIPSLFAFSRASVYLLMSPETIQRNPTSVVLRATSIHGPLALEIPVEVLSERAETIHQLAAKKAVQDLEEGRGWIFDAKDEAGVLIKQRYPSSFDDLVKKEAVRLGEKFQVAGKWCSFVAVSANDAEIAANLVEEPFSDPLTVTEAGYSESLLGIPSSMPQRTLIQLSSSVCGAPSASFRRGGRAKGRGFGGNSASAAEPERLVVYDDRKVIPQGPLFGGPPFLQSSSVTPQGSQNAFGQSSPPFGGQTFHQSSSVTPQSPQYVFGQSSSVTPQGSQNVFGSSTPQGIQSVFGQSSSVTPQGGLPVADAFMESSGLVSCKSRSPQRPGAANGPDRFFGVRLSRFPGTATAEAAVPPNWELKSATEKVLGLISLQDFEGCWHEDAKEISAILGFEIPEMPAASANGRIWMTLLVVCFLEVKNGNEEGIWGLVVEKARDWLAGNVTTGLEGLEKQAKEFVVGH